jgi:hypothetical protein
MDQVLELKLNKSPQKNGYGTTNFIMHYKLVNISQT